MYAYAPKTDSSARGRSAIASHTGFGFARCNSTVWSPSYRKCAGTTTGRSRSLPGTISSPKSWVLRKSRHSASSSAASCLWMSISELCGRGGRTRTAEPSGPKPDALPTAPHPGRVAKSHRRTDRMTVRADELAFRELFVYQFRLPISKLIADFSELYRARQVVPLHRLGWKDATAVRAWAANL